MQRTCGGDAYAKAEPPLSRIRIIVVQLLRFSLRLASFPSEDAREGGRVTDSNGLGPRKAQKRCDRNHREIERDRQKQRERKAPFPPHPHPFHQLHKQQNHRLSGWGWSICYCQCIALVVVRWVVSALFGGGGGGLRLLAIAFTMLMLRFSSANRTLDWRAGLDAYSTGAWGSVAYTFS